MTVDLPSNRFFGSPFVIPGCLALLGIAVPPVFAQPIVPAGDGTGTVVTPEGDRFDIGGGRVSGDGANLFHSFDRFGLDAGQIANFLAHPNLENILGRVVGGDASYIDGLLQVSGGDANLFLVNPAGIAFGANARLNVPADFTATTATGVGFGDNNWFDVVGSNNWSNLLGSPNGLEFATANPGAIVNAGNLSIAPEANLNLIGGVVANTGTLQTSGGQISVMAVEGESMVRLSAIGNVLSLEVPDRRLEPLNLTPLTVPQLLAGGQVLGHASQLMANGNGTVSLVGSGLVIDPRSGTAIVSGTVDVSDVTAALPSSGIQILGDRIGLIDATLNASGINGGGNIWIGGDFRGLGTVPNASRTFVNENTSIFSDAIDFGNGGRVIVWADDTTVFRGSIYARGGSSPTPHTPDLTPSSGGFVEISGKEQLVFRGSVDVSAPQGEPGTIFFDPDEFDVGSDTMGGGSTDMGSDTMDGGSTDMGSDTMGGGSTDMGSDTIDGGSMDMGSDTIDGGSTDMGSDTMGGGSTDMGSDTMGGGSTDMGDSLGAGDMDMGSDTMDGGSMDMGSDTMDGGSMDMGDSLGAGDMDMGDSLGAGDMDMGSDTMDGGSMDMGDSLGGGDMDIGGDSLGGGDMDIGGDTMDGGSMDMGDSLGGGDMDIGGDSLGAGDMDIGGDSLGGGDAIDMGGDTMDGGEQPTLTPDDLQNLNGNVILSANDDITISTTTTPEDRDGGPGIVIPGSIELRAGRSINIDADIDTSSGNGDIILRANNVDAAAGLRNPGAANINQTPGTILNAGDGNITLEIGSAGAVGNVVVGNLQTQGDVQISANGGNILRSDPNAVISASAAFFQTSGAIGTQNEPLRINLFVVSPASDGVRVFYDNLQTTGTTTESLENDFSITENTEFENSDNASSDAQAPALADDKVLNDPGEFDGDSKFDTGDAGGDFSSDDGIGGSSDGDGGESSQSGSDFNSNERISRRDSNGNESSQSSGDLNGDESQNDEGDGEGGGDRNREFDGEDFAGRFDGGYYESSSIDAQAVARIDSNRSSAYRSLVSDELTSTLSASPREALAAITEQTGNHSAVVYVTLLPNQVELVVFTADGVPIRKVVPEVSREKVIAAGRELRRTLTNPRFRNSTRYLASAQKLHTWLIAPLQDTLEEASIDTLLFSMDEGLRTLPVAALHDGDRFLIENYSLSLIPSMSLVDPRYRSLHDTHALGMGASEFTDFQPLPAVPVELYSITEHVWQGSAFINEDFTRENLISQRQRFPYPIVHLATHGEFQPGDPSNSYIQLWDEKLGLDELRDLGWNNPPVELLVLSACRTAVGSTEAELGFAGLAIAAGVKSALASLWYVSDEGTLALMTEFYSYLGETNIKAEALRQAQLAMIRGHVSLESGELRRSGVRGNITLPPELATIGDRDLSHPYYWSAFTTIGSPW